ncbi:ABC transporter ATP-binding protein [Mycolicibacter sinensis]|uniref:Trehalose import ATP-binding protein SugC n=1 Tax=Mycolicibacter sinensis (strain JDM601) TaxID=875328 RepID=A0A1A3U586_MYCSD|nr:sn-glycerol-3-phosphate ABC transporter ATP-binding protein UgpC [Mycolicibacter sinensis]OBK89837.1 sugar ABC transporter ATP-binding protein [Mycolicibacter sinensis]
MAAVTFDSVTRHFPGAERPALDKLNLSVEDGEFMVLVGPSGCGKTTTLRMLAGLEPVDAGRICIGSADVTGTDPGDRDIAMVFQNYALYPHMTVAQNMGFALKVAKTPKAEIRARVAETAQLLGLQTHLGRKPKDLSGGERQRVAMGRAIVRRPQVFLMDEPLSNLDAMLRVQTRNQIAELQRRLGITTVYVTHDQVEAMTMGDRVAVLRDGVLQQCAPPRELYRHPANVFVAGFIGSPSMNLFTVPVVQGAVSLGGYTLALPREIAASGEELVIGVRPEHLVLDDSGVDVDVEFVEELGADTYVHGRIIESGQAPRRAVTARMGGDNSLRRDDRVRLRPDPEQVHFFSADGMRLGL